MDYHYENGRVLLTSCPSFDIPQTLGCGQCFRFSEASGEYIVTAFSRALRITQASGVTEFYPCTLAEFGNIWIPYFDLERDYSQIKSVLAKDPVLERAIAFADGIRILNQDPWECLISFIISQNMNIPRIKKLVETLAQRYGTRHGDFCAFPTPEQLLAAELSGLMDCKTGFRAKYIYDATQKVARGALPLSDLAARPTGELKSALRGIYGVGDKVADCVSLFSFGRHEVFPMDVWIKRAMQNLYFAGKEVPAKYAYEFAQDKFGPYAGFAQQYLFYYMRENGRSL